MYSPKFRSCVTFECVSVSVSASDLSACALNQLGKLMDGMLQGRILQCLPLHQLLRAHQLLRTHQLHLSLLYLQIEVRR